jgi:hypothetical protein
MAELMGGCMDRIIDTEPNVKLSLGSKDMAMLTITCMVLAAVILAVYVTVHNVAQ